MRLRTIIALCVAPASFAASCALTYFEDETSGPTTTPSGVAGAAGAIGQGGGGGAGGGVCDHATWPLPPDGGTAGGSEDFVLALRRVYSQDSSGEPAGWDLDNTCTCQGQGSSCVAPSSTLDLVDDCDALEGRDNNFEKVLGPLGIFAGQSNLMGSYSQGAEEGEWSLLMRVQDYNGEPNDREVRLSWYLTNGAMAPPPGWVGTDGWEVTSSSLGPGPDGGLDIDTPLLVDEHAYVVDDVVVATLPSVDLVLGGGVNRFEFRLTAGWITGELYQEGAIWKLRDGVLTGRVTVADLFRAVSSYRDTDGQLLCTDQAGYSVFKTFLCALPDILSALGPATEPCDAISLAIGFDAEQAQLGIVETPDASMPGCPPESDPANDSCSNP